MGKSETDILKREEILFFIESCSANALNNMRKIFLKNLYSLIYIHCICMCMCKK